MLTAAAPANITANAIFTGSLRMNPLIELKNFGQSIWFDNIRRSLLTSGELRRMMDEYGVTGVTSNPAIFEKAVSAGTEYDYEIARLVKTGLT